MFLSIAARNQVFDPIFDSQEVSRLLTDCMAKPGKINYLPDVGLYLGKEHSFPLLIAKTLLDVDVSFAYLGPEKREFNREVMQCTGAKLGDMRHADFIFCNGKEKQSELFLAHRGMFEYATLGTTLIMTVNLLFDQKPQSLRNLARVELIGSGVNRIKRVWLTGMDYDNLDWLSQQSQLHPFRLDTILVDIEGKMACMPRSSRLKWHVDWAN